MNRRAHHPARRHPRSTKSAGESRQAHAAAEAGGHPRAAPPTAQTEAHEPGSPAPAPARGTLQPAPDEKVTPDEGAAPDKTAARDAEPPRPLSPTETQHPEAPARLGPHPNGSAHELAADRADQGAGLNGSGPDNHVPLATTGDPGCTAPQLRRFIKSRAYVPMHELRRRFGIDGDDDDVTGVEIDRERRVFVGLPTREGRLLGELFRAGDVGYELSLDPISPIVVGVFPMRPIARG